MRIDEIIDSWGFVKPPTPGKESPIDLSVTLSRVVGLIIGLAVHLAFLPAWRSATLIHNRCHAFLMRNPTLVIKESNPLGVNEQKEPYELDQEKRWHRGPHLGV